MAQYLNIIVKSCQISDSETYFHLKYIMLLQIPTSIGNEFYCINSDTLVYVIPIKQIKHQLPHGTPRVQPQEQQQQSSGPALLAVPAWAAGNKTVLDVPGAQLGCAGTGRAQNPEGSSSSWALHCSSPAQLITRKGEFLLAPGNVVKCSDGLQKS